MCACTCRRNSAIIFCADFESSCVSVKDVSPCTIVAASTPRTIGVSSSVCRFPITLSMKYFVEAGSTSPHTRFTAMSTKPNASRPRRGRISVQISGKAFQVFLRFSFLLSAEESFSLAIDEWSHSAWMRRAVRELYTTHLVKRLGCMPNAKDRGREFELIRAGSAARNVRGRWPLDIEDAANEFAQRDAEMAPQSPLQAGVVLRAAEKVAHQLPENRTASQKLHHPRRDCGAQKRAAIKAPHDARRKFELRRKCRPHARRIFFRAAFRQRPAQQLARAHGIEQAFAGQRIDPRRRVAHHRPVFPEHMALRERALPRRGQHVTVKARAFGRNFLLLNKRVQVRLQFRARV